jgi:hypothetical protein
MSERGKDYLTENDYVDLSVAQEEGKAFLDKGPRGGTVESFLRSYCSPDVFGHTEAYHLCAVANFFPMKFLGKDRSTVVKISKINLSDSPKENTYEDLRTSLELHYLFNRIKIIKRVAVVYGLDPKKFEEIRK